MRLLLLYRIFVLAIKLMMPLDLCSVATQMETTETTVTREQLQSAVILCGEQEKNDYGAYAVGSTSHRNELPAVSLRVNEVL